MYIILFFIIDQVVKLLVKVNLQPVSFVKLIDGLISLKYLENKGAAFGMLYGKQYILIAVTLVFIALITYIYIKDIRKQKNKFLKLGYEFIIAGGLGNLIDRMFRGYVIDYIKLEFIDFPIFNLADIFINIGAFTIIFCILFEEVNKLKSKSK